MEGTISSDLHKSSSWLHIQHLSVCLLAIDQSCRVPAAVADPLFRFLRGFCGCSEMMASKKASSTEGERHHELDLRPLSTEVRCTQDLITCDL